MARSGGPGVAAGAAAGAAVAVRWAHRWFAAQAIGGAAWWIAVAVSPAVREATLGSLPPVPIAVADVPLFVVGSALAAVGLRRVAVVVAAWTLLVLVGLALWATVTREAGWGVLVMAASAVGSVLATTLLRTGRIPTAWVASGPFRVRTADADASTGAHVARTAGQIVVFWGLALGVVPAVLVFLEHRWRVAVPLPPDVARAVTAVGIAAFLLASWLGIAAAAAMSTRGRGTPLPAATANLLVVAGPYRVVRNPMAIAGIAQGVAVGLTLSSWLVVVYALAGSLVWNAVIRPIEESDLEARFGDAFRAYRDAVRCWVPTFPPAPVRP